MPRRNRTMPADLEAQVMAELDAEMDDLVAAIVAEQGLSAGAVRLSPEQEIALWGQADPMVDPTTLKQQLMTGTVPPELYDPEGDQRFALLRMNEDIAQEWAELLAGTAQQPLDEEMARDVADTIAYPGRLTVLRPYEDDPKAGVEKAKSIHARWQRHTGQMATDTAGGYDVPVEEGATY